MIRKKVMFFIGVIFALCILLWGIVYFTATKQRMKFEMDVCTLDGETDVLSMDAVREGSLVEPIHYNGNIYFKGKQYAAYQKVKRIPRFIAMVENIKEVIRGAEYDIFLRIDSYGELINRIMIEDIMYNETDGSYRIWMRYTDSTLFDPNSGEGKGKEFFGPASTAEEAEKVKEAFYEYYLNAD